MFLLFLFLHAASAMFPRPNIANTINVTNQWISKVNTSGGQRRLDDFSIFSNFDTYSFMNAGDVTFAFFTAPPDMLSILDTDPRVLYTEPVSLVSVQDNWNLIRIGHTDIVSTGVFHPIMNGSGVDIYIVDTGIRTTHEQYSERVVTTVSMVRTEQDIYSNLNVHGTHVSGIAAGQTMGVARGANLVGVRVLDQNGGGRTDDVIKGLLWVLERAGNKTSVVNLSLGGSRTQALNDVVQKVSDAGHIVVVAAGNDAGDACASSPAMTGGQAKSTFGVITVAATTGSDNIASFSNYGPCVDIFAPGMGIYSSIQVDDTSYGYLSGTSMSAPHVSGVAAILLQKNEMNKEAAITELFAIASKDKVKSPRGSPNLLLFINSTATDSPTTASPTMVSPTTVSPTTASPTQQSEDSLLQKPYFIVPIAMVGSIVLAVIIVFTMLRLKSTKKQIMKI